jgi:DNA-directed RNA polymerase subunit RPC12/RpoP
VTDAVDGNAISGLLLEIFGIENHNDMGACAGCGLATMVAEYTVYLSGPGTVVRCPHCDHQLIVLVRRHGITSVDTSGLN